MGSNPAGGFFLFYSFIFIYIFFLKRIEILNTGGCEVAPFWQKSVHIKKLHPIFQNMNKERNERLVLMSYIGDELHVHFRPASTSDLYVAEGERQKGRAILTDMQQSERLANFSDRFDLTRDDNYNFMAAQLSQGKHNIYLQEIKNKNTRSKK